MIRRRQFHALVASTGVAGLLSTGGTSAAAAGKRQPARNVVLVHGAYADGSCWSEVIPRLQAAGLTVTSVQNPLTSLADDVAATNRILDLQEGPTVLVAHSYGGSVISQAGLHPAVRSLVYLSARAPAPDEDYGALAARFPTPPANAGLIYQNGFGALTEEAFLTDFANGVPPLRARTLYAAQGRIAQTLFSERTTVAAWQSKPTRYVITTADRTTSPALQQYVAARMRAKSIEIASGHLSLITHPRTVANFILDAC